MNLYLSATLAGLCFSIWPLCMNRTGLNGYVSAACFGLATLVGVLPFAYLSNHGLSLPSANWWMVLLAGIFGAVGLMAFNGMLSKASLNNVGTLIVIVNLVQLVVMACYQASVNHSLPPGRIGGFLAAALATYLLVR